MCVSPRHATLKEGISAGDKAGDQTHPLLWVSL